MDAFSPITSCFVTSFKTVDISDHLKVATALHIFKFSTESKVPSVSGKPQNTLSHAWSINPGAVSYTHLFFTVFEK